MKAGEKYILENAPSQFDSTPLDTSDNMQKEGYEIKMTKKDGNGQSTHLLRTITYKIWHVHSVVVWLLISKVSLKLELFY